MMAKFMARQGDVLVVSAQIPASAKPKARDNGRVILAYGEVTGHTHEIANPDSVGAALTVAESATFLRLAKGAQLIHQEHATVDLPAGDFQVIRQREYTPTEIRRVAD